MLTTYFSFGGAVVGLIVAALLGRYVKKQKIESQKVADITSAIREGALAFLNKEYQILFLFVLIVAVIMFLTPIGWQTAITFIMGAFFSILSGNLGMRVATRANGRVAMAVKHDLHSGLRLAFASGSVMGFVVVALGVLGVALSLWIFKNPEVAYGFGFGASSVALFARVGGGIYTKAADVGADLVGKVEQGIPEDDPRNPAVIADNVGDNVGDVAGMGADLYESYVDSIIAASVLGAGVVGIFGMRAFSLPLLIALAGIFASLVGTLVIWLSHRGHPQSILNRGVFTTSAIVLLGTAIGIHYLNLIKPWELFGAIAVGLIVGVVNGMVTEYYTSSKHKPSRRLAEAAKNGAGTNLIEGLALGMRSTVVPVLVICVTVAIAYKLAGIYGIALAAVGMLSTLAITLATDSYGPVADNAAGIAEMAELGQEVRERAEKLDAVGNTTAAIGKGFSVGSGALIGVALLVSYVYVANIQAIDLKEPKVLIGLFIGGLLPFLFSSFLMRAVGKAAFYVVDEVRRQFRDIKGIMEGKAKPEYGHCVQIVTSGALRQMVMPSLVAITVPVLVGFILGKAALGGLLAGAIVCGFLMAIMMANAGGAWDNAKKYIEEGHFGGKGSATHKAAVVGDTVGDPFKDTAGPSVNILIKVVSILALIIAPLL
ncbi:MAG: sodium-translocating pyrophosphatase [Candidatus Portnoybacteria bacterium CG_4_10_14_0_2_um_filter_39_11]|uniref:Putative K(+)-stimulated pyrophosphate-energized sodium pump n=1 Tax=Candidatus Portnoybacteria bacterium CG_4_10_14_0_2_um_filter_39_11 TaxID=1974797 RepID=A0A2M7UKJ1_9BACT|nr:MAG: sodium-translocating pyrophosphatase [Parcubacteria group bacterium CG1_02_40_25]PIZ71672.1 MAG: sodium-translocating pyrophosphatase [Candidatus Portnoybacteria bacterium CG_4_10_14_0_2_um_filter_39_11]